MSAGIPDTSTTTPESTRRGTTARTPAELHPLARLPEEWRTLLAARGERAFHAAQIFRWIHARGVLEPERMTDLRLELRSWLGDQGLTEPAKVAQVERSTDGTRKLVLELSGAARIECVLIPMSRRIADHESDPESDEEDAEPATSAERVTLCVSTQFGCAMACAFCASGQAGLVRGLGAAEIVAQVAIAKRFLEPGEELRNLVFMGMGEPLHHYDETARALRILMHPDGIGMSPRRITVSTVGLVPGIRRLGRDFGGKLGLAVSLHAPDDVTRDRIVPLNKRYPLSELIQALRDYPLPRRRRITIEYTLISGINDSDEHARRLARLVSGLRVKLNLIPMNSIAASELHAPGDERVSAFREILANLGLSVSVRARRGDDVAAACGQLAFPANLMVRRPR